MSHRSNLLRHSLSALSAALLVHIGSAGAGSPPSRAPRIPTQQMIQELLTGTRPVHGTPGAARHDASTWKSADTQGFVGQLLLGPVPLHIAVTEDRLSNTDTQAMVRRILAGDPARTAPVL